MYSVVGRSVDIHLPFLLLVISKTGNLAMWKFLARETEGKQQQVTTFPIFFLICKTGNSLKKISSFWRSISAKVVTSVVTKRVRS